MKTLIIYNSKTGFTKRYAEWIATATQGDLCDFQAARKKGDSFYDAYDTIAFGGWIMAGSVTNSKWFVEKAVFWNDKRLALFCVGASPVENPDIPVLLEKVIPDTLKDRMKAFYCPGGLNYDAMKFPSSMALRMLSNSLLKKKDATPDDIRKGEMLSHSYDITEVKYADAVAEYLRCCNRE